MTNEGIVELNWRKIEIRDLVDSGVLKAGDILRAKRPVGDVSDVAMVLENGSIELESGDRFTTPTGAAVALGADTKVNGWEFWVHERTGSPLGELRER